jgi:predicted nucleotidyltransferase
VEIKFLEEIPVREKDRQAIEAYINRIHELIGDELHSVLLYGSAAKNNYFPGSSDINLLVLVRNVTPEIMQKTAPVIKGFKMRSKIDTFLADIDDIVNSADVFPIRFLDIRNHHILLYGEDVFAEMEIEAPNLRLDLEGQMRNMVRNLRQSYIFSNYTSQELRNILVENFSRLSCLLTAMLHLHEIKPPPKKQELIQKASKEFKLDLSVFENVINLKSGGNNLPISQMQKIYDEYIEIIDKIVEIADKIDT